MKKKTGEDIIYKPNDLYITTVADELRALRRYIRELDTKLGILVTHLGLEWYKQPQATKLRKKRKRKK